MKEDKNQNQQPLDNPVLPDTTDWWEEVCKANNEVNHFPKEDNED
tara:strand:- start:1429 stop:1563 length:135 start_codon:yes stop_codon:yes gene_type:complete